MRIERLTHHGRGLADDGTLIERTLPGEDVALAEDGSPRILLPSPDRVTPPCRHFRRCGGCAMQHASDPFVADWKAGIVRRALAARGIDAEIAGIDTSPPLSRRRARLSGRRTGKGATVGFHARASGLIVEVPDCQLLLPQLTALRPALEEITTLAASRKGEVGIVATWSVAGADILIETERPLDGPLRIALAALAERHRLARLTWGIEPIVTRDAPVQLFGRARVVPPPGAFLQATAEGEAALVRAVRDAVGGATRIVDLFAGSGTLSLPLADAAEVHAVEGSGEMLAALAAGARGAPGLHRVTTEMRDLFRRPLLAPELRRFDAVVIDPPRAGAEAQVAEIAAARPGVVAMVSCNPVTFARDAALLIAGGYAIGAIRVVDQFRWSDHVELATQFTMR